MKHNHDIAIDQAIDWITDHYAVVGIVVSGSIVRGNPHAHSDFDIYVIHRDAFRQRVQRFFNGIPCEIFINTADHVYSYLDSDWKDNRPTTAHMLSTGRIYLGEDDPDLLKLIDTARTYLVKPYIADPQRILAYRYAIALLFEDATDTIASDPATGLYFLNKAVDELIEFAYMKYQVPMPRAKERLAALKKIDSAVGTLVESYFISMDIGEKYQLASKLITILIGEKGFFEWESARQ